MRELIIEGVPTRDPQGKWFIDYTRSLMTTELVRDRVGDVSYGFHGLPPGFEDGGDSYFGVGKETWVLNIAGDTEDEYKKILRNWLGLMQAPAFTVFSAPQKTVPALPSARSGNSFTTTDDVWTARARLVGSAAIERINPRTARVTFIVELTGGFWKSITDYTLVSTVTLDASPITVDLDAVLGSSTAPVTDGFVRIRGPLDANGLVTIRDRANPFRAIHYQGGGTALTNAQYVVIDIKSLRATLKSSSAWGLSGGTDVSANVLTSGDGQFSLTPQIANFPDGPNDYFVELVVSGGSAVSYTLQRRNLITNPAAATITGYSSHLGSSAGVLSVLQAPWNAARKAVRVTGLLDLITNGAFGTNATSWTALGTGSIARSTTQFRSGPASLRKTWATASAGVEGARQTVSDLVVGQSYTFSAWLYVPTGAAGAAPAVALAGGAVGNAVTATNTWTNSSVTFTASATSHVVQVVSTAGSTAGQFVYIDDVGLHRNEQGNIQTARVPTTQIMPSGSVVNFRVRVASNEAARTFFIRLHNRETGDLLATSVSDGFTPGTAGTDITGNVTLPYDISAGQCDLIIVSTTNFDPTTNMSVGDVIMEIGTSGTYFDGNTTDTSALAYSWTGSVDYSSSEQFSLGTEYGQFDLQLRRSYIS